jgi:hypothetical protein
MMINLVEANQVPPSAYLSGGECHGLYQQPVLLYPAEVVDWTPSPIEIEERTRKPLNASLSSAYTFVWKLCAIREGSRVSQQRMPFVWKLWAVAHFLWHHLVQF